MKKHILTLAFIALIGFAFADKDGTKSNQSESSLAQTISFSGKVVDFNSGEVLTGVEVKLEGTDIKTYTDFDGKFKFKDVKPGQYNIIASYISYDKSLIENFKAKKGSNKIDIKLQSSK